MQLLSLLALTLTVTTHTTLALPQSSSSSSAPTTFPADIQQSLQNLQGYILKAINAYAQDAPEQETITDYSSAGRSLDFFLRETFLPAGPSACPQAGQPLPAQAQSRDEGIQDMQQAQLALINVSQDAQNDDFSQAVYDTCDAIRKYGAGALNY